MNVERRIRPEIETIPAIPDLKIIKPKVFPDSRGFFSETYNVEEWKELGFVEEFKQDNHSYSHHNVLRGLHAQPGMGKLVSVAVGRIYDVAVDARKDSPTFGQWHGVYLTSESKHAFWVPDGFLHGFQVLSREGAHVMYKCTDVYNAQTEYGINPFDKDLSIDWPEIEKCIVSERDNAHPAFSILRNL